MASHDAMTYTLLYYIEKRKKTFFIAKKPTVRLLFPSFLPIFKLTEVNLVDKIAFSPFNY